MAGLVWSLVTFGAPLGNCFILCCFFFLDVVMFLLSKQVSSVPILIYADKVQSSTSCARLPRFYLHPNRNTLAFGDFLPIQAVDKILVSLG